MASQAAPRSTIDSYAPPDTLQWTRAMDEEEDTAADEAFKLQEEEGSSMQVQARTVRRQSVVGEASGGEQPAFRLSHSTHLTLPPCPTPSRTVHPPSDPVPAQIMIGT